MKQNFYLLFFLIVILAVTGQQAGAQEYSINVEGHVTDLFSGFPIADHEVIIAVYGAGSSETFLLFTDSTGLFHKDSIPVVINTGSVLATIYDCNGDPHELQQFFTLAQITLIFDFEICSDTLTSCAANFVYNPVPGSNNAVMFEDISSGSPDQWQWDFGDGISSIQQNPVHTYNSLGPFNVCLTIWADGGYCIDSLCKQVILDTTTVNCSNWFTYESIDQITFSFIGDAFPPADSFFWDFGDGTTGTGSSIDHTYFLSSQYVTVLLTTVSYNPIAGDSCVAISSQEIWVAAQGNDCTNWFDFITNDGYTFDFMGFSMPEAIIYSWDFGDGNTDTGPLVTHDYSAGTSGDIPVTLTTFHFSPAGGDSCIAVSSQIITVGGGGNCNAFFSWSSNTANPFIVQFTDESIGPVNSWAWDFGDGQSSVQPSPLHTYTSPGIYQVCLNIMSDSLGFLCTDNYCETIVIDYSLTAGFTFYLDTISGDTAKYYFQDNSAGDPETWTWDFGDGTGSAIPNPVHQFEQGFSADVCLTVTRNFPGAGVFSDMHCENIEAPSYFYLGGILFMDNYPINNQSGDTTVVDTGRAWLYRKYSNTLVPVDTTSFYELGFYVFPPVREGDYIIKSGLTQGSQHYENWLPAYHENASNWQEASVISLSGSNNFDRNIFMVPLAGTTQGPGMINGFVSSTSSGILTNDELKGIDVMLYNESGVLLDYHKTLPGGAFGFQGLALGTYTLYAEAAGLFTIPHTITLDDAAPSPVLTLELFEDNVGTDEYADNNICIGKPYPNPAVNDIFIDICPSETGLSKIYIYDVRGEVLCTKNDINFNPGKRISVDVADLPPGLYFIKLVNSVSNTVVARKFIK